MKHESNTLLHPQAIIIYKVNNVGIQFSCHMLCLKVYKSSSFSIVLAEAKLEGKRNVIHKVCMVYSACSILVTLHIN